MTARDPARPLNLFRLISALELGAENSQDGQATVHMRTDLLRGLINSLDYLRQWRRVEEASAREEQRLMRLRSDVRLEQARLRRFRDGVNERAVCWFYALLATLITVDVLGLWP